MPAPKKNVAAAPESSEPQPPVETPGLVEVTSPSKASNTLYFNGHVVNFVDGKAFVPSSLAQALKDAGHTV